MKKKRLHTKKKPKMSTAVLIPGFFTNYLRCRLRHHDWKSERKSLSLNKFVFALRTQTKDAQKAAQK